MNFIKDFFYKKNDVIVVLIILIAAGILIYDRINVIMDYPEKYAQQHTEQSSDSPASDTENVAE